MHGVEAGRCSVRERGRSARREIPPTLLVVNGTLEKGVVRSLADDAGTRAIEVRDCRGRVTHTDSIGLETGLHHIDIPPAGVAVLK
jgi:alpha-galactosidase